LVIESQTDPIVSTNRSRLLQVLVNLLINAAHSFGDGAVSENKIRVGITRVGLSGAKIEIEDTGVGISEEDLPRIFDPFFTTKGNADGTGLGLSICRELMSKLGGDIEVASALGRGTKFSLTLSSATDVLETEVPASQPEMGASACKLRILIVDAEFPVARSLMRMLDGSDTVVVTDGGEAIELLTADPSFDLVFCDLMMPVVSGVDVYESVKANTPELASRFVFTTGGAFTERAKRFLASVANPCLEKPFNSKELKRLIATSTVNR
jgi:CheY-like chemotaxis protein